MTKHTLLNVNSKISDENQSIEFNLKSLLSIKPVAFHLFDIR